MIELTHKQLYERALFGDLARHDLIIFASLNTPVPDDPFNCRKSRFQWLPHHYSISRELERIEKGEINRLEIELPPRHGKSEIAVRNFVVWWMSKQPIKSIITVTHTDSLAKEHGRDCRDYWTGMGFNLAFGKSSPASLRSDTQASDRLQTVAGGVATFSGRGGLGAGVGADLMIFDDFFKNSQEAESTTVRDEAWRTFTSDCKSRLNNEGCPVVIIGSRRHEDDVQGRLFDPTNPHYDEKEATRWTRIRLPALSEGADVDPLKRPEGESLWPQKFSAQFYLDKKHHKSDIVRIDFQTQDQCNPRPQEGTWFKKSWLKTYKRADKPENLQIYVASDHAYRKGEKNDSSCLLVIGLDPTGAIYVLPETWWKRAETMEMVDAMFNIVKEMKPSQWWAARDAISGSLKPFIERRMLDQSIFFPLDDSIRESKDLVARSASIRARMAMGLVFWPQEWPQWADAENQLLSFPGKHDDLCLAAGTLVKMSNGSQKPIEQIQVGDLVCTPLGIQCVEASQCTGLNHVNRYYFSDGNYLDATPNHPIAIKSTSLEQKFVIIDALTIDNDIVTMIACENIPAKQMLSHTPDIDTVVIQNRNTGTTKFIGTQRNQGAGFCTDIFGKIQMALKYQKDLTCIIGMKIRLTIQSIILSCFQSKFIWLNTCPSVQERQSTLLDLHQYVQPQQRPLANSAQPQNGKRSWQTEPESNGKTNLILKSNAKHVLTSFSRRFQHEQKPAELPVSSVTISSKKELGLLPTFNLTVANENVFFANGILTHNCAALAILGMGLSQMVKPQDEVKPKDYLAKPMTMDWVKQGHNIEKARHKTMKEVQGW